MVSAIDNIVHHVAYGLKALEEYVSNIFTFIGQKSFNFNIYSLSYLILFIMISMVLIIAQ